MSPLLSVHAPRPKYIHVLCSSSQPGTASSFVGTSPPPLSLVEKQRFNLQPNQPLSCIYSQWADMACTTLQPYSATEHVTAIALWTNLNKLLWNHGTLTNAQATKTFHAWDILTMLRNRSWSFLLSTHILLNSKQQRRCLSQHKHHAWCGKCFLGSIKQATRLWTVYSTDKQQHSRCNYINTLFVF